MSERPQINFEQLAADIKLLQEVGEAEFKKILAARFGLTSEPSEESEMKDVDTTTA